MKRLLRWLFDFERGAHGWDMRVPWPAMRLFYRRGLVPGHQLGIYRLGAFEYSFVWWWELRRH